MAFTMRAMKVSPNSATLEEARNRVFELFRSACRSLPSVMEIYNLDDVVNKPQLRSSVASEFRRNSHVIDMLVFKGMEELGNITEHAKQRHHIIGQYVVGNQGLVQDAGSKEEAVPCCMWEISFEKVRKLTVGQQVKVRLSVKQPRFGWSGHRHLSIRTVSAIDGDGKLRIYTPAGSKSWMVDPSEVEVVQEEELRVGDWVRVKPTVSTPSYHWGEVSHSSLGVVYRIDGAELWVAFCFMDRLWLCKAAEMERVRPFRMGDKVKIKEGLITPRWGWGMEMRASKGEIVGVDASGKLRIKFQWREGRPWIGDPADIMLDRETTPFL